MLFACECAHICRQVIIVFNRMFFECLEVNTSTSCHFRFMIMKYFSHKLHLLQFRYYDIETNAENAFPKI